MLISRVTSPCIEVQILFLRTTSAPSNYVSTTPRIFQSIHPSLSRLQHLYVYSYAIHNPVSPHRYCCYIKPSHATPTRSPPCLDTSTESTSLHRHTQPGQRTRIPLRLRNVCLRKPLTWLHRRQPLHTNLSRTSWNWNPKWDKSLHHGYITFSTWLTIEDIDVDIVEIYHTCRSQFQHVFEYNRSNTYPTPLHVWTIIFLLGSYIYNSHSYTFNELFYYFIVNQLLELI